MLFRVPLICSLVRARRQNRGVIPQPLPFLHHTASDENVDEANKRSAVIRNVHQPISCLCEAWSLSLTELLTGPANSLCTPMRFAKLRKTNKNSVIIFTADWIHKSIQREGKIRVSFNPCLLPFTTLGAFILRQLISQY